MEPMKQTVSTDPTEPVEHGRPSQRNGLTWATPEVTGTKRDAADSFNEAFHRKLRIHEGRDNRKIVQHVAKLPPKLRPKVLEAAQPPTSHKMQIDSGPSILKFVHALRQPESVTMSGTSVVSGAQEIAKTVKPVQGRQTESPPSSLEYMKEADIELMGSSAGSQVPNAVRYETASPPSSLEYMKEKDIELMGSSAGSQVRECLEGAEIEMMEHAQESKDSGISFEMVQPPTPDANDLRPWFTPAEIEAIGARQEDHAALSQMVADLDAELVLLADQLHQTGDPDERLYIAQERSEIFEQWNGRRKQLLAVEQQLLNAWNMQRDRINFRRDQKVLRAMLAKGKTFQDHAEAMNERREAQQQVCTHDQGIETVGGSCQRCYTSVGGNTLACKACHLKACWPCLMTSDEWEDEEEEDTHAGASPDTNTFKVPSSYGSDYSTAVEEDEAWIMNDPSLNFKRVAVKPLPAAINWTAAQPTDVKITTSGRCADWAHEHEKIIGHTKCHECKRVDIAGGFRCRQCPDIVCFGCKVGKLQDSELTEMERLWIVEASREHYFSRTYALPDDTAEVVETAETEETAETDYHAARSIAWWKKRLAGEPQSAADIKPAYQFEDASMGALVDEQPHAIPSSLKETFDIADAAMGQLIEE